MPHSPRVRFLKILLHIIFFFTGIGTVIIGQLLPIMAKHFSLNDLQVSFFFPMQFAGSLCGTTITSRLAIRNNYMAAAMLGGVAMSAGTLLMNVDSFAFCLLGFFIVGMGIGLTLPSINMMIIEVDPERSGPALSVLNFCWGIGAILCKPFVDTFSTDSNIGITTIVFALPLLLFTLMLRIGAGRPKNSPVKKHDPAADDHVPIWTMPIAWAIALFNFIHVGFESGMGGWLTTYTGRLAGEPLTHWLSPTLLYFSLFVIGRGVSTVMFRYLNENQMLFLGLAIVLVGMGLVLTAQTVLALSLGSAVSGFGTSWIFPTNVSRFSKTFGPAATRRAVPLFMAGTFGAAAVTWLIGFISNQTGNLRSGMYVLAISIIFLLIVQTGLAIRGSRVSRSESKLTMS